MSNDEKADRIELPIVWVGLEELPVRAANQFLLQKDDDAGEYYLYAGLLTPPVALGPPEAQLQAMSEMTHVEIQPIARMSMNERRVKELRDLLTRVLDRAEAQRNREQE